MPHPRQPLRICLVLPDIAPRSHRGNVSAGRIAGTEARVPGNQFRTWALMAAMSGLILLAGAAAGGARWLAIALVFMVAMNGTVYFLSGRVALTALRARPVSGSARSSAPSFTRSSESFPTSARQPMPRLVSPAMQPNAFATGRSPRTAAICCTEGVLRLLDARVARRARARAIAYLQPGRAHLVRRCRARDGDYVRGGSGVPHPAAIR